MAKFRMGGEPPSTISPHHCNAWSVAASEEGCRYQRKFEVRSKEFKLISTVRLVFRAPVLLRRGIGEQIGQTAVDALFLAPHGGVETGRQARLQLLRRHSGDVLRGALTNTLGRAARGRIPIIV